MNSTRLALLVVVLSFAMMAESNAIINVSGTYANCGSDTINASDVTCLSAYNYITILPGHSNINIYNFNSDSYGSHGIVGSYVTNVRIINATIRHCTSCHATVNLAQSSNIYLENINLGSNWQGSDSISLTDISGSCELNQIHNFPSWLFSPYQGYNPSQLYMEHVDNCYLHDSNNLGSNVYLVNNGVLTFKNTYGYSPYGGGGNGNYISNISSIEFMGTVGHSYGMNIYDSNVYVLDNSAGSFGLTRGTVAFQNTNMTWSAAFTGINGITINEPGLNATLSFANSSNNIVKNVSLTSLSIDQNSHSNRITQNTFYPACGMSGAYYVRSAVIALSGDNNQFDNNFMRDCPNPRQFNAFSFYITLGNTAQNNLFVSNIINATARLVYNTNNSSGNSIYQNGYESIITNPLAAIASGFIPFTEPVSSRWPATLYYGVNGTSVPYIDNYISPSGTGNFFQINDSMPLTAKLMPKDLDLNITIIKPQNYSYVYDPAFQVQYLISTTNQLRFCYIAIGSPGGPWVINVQINCNLTSLQYPTASLTPINQQIIIGAYTEDGANWAEGIFKYMGQPTYPTENDSTTCKEPGGCSGWYCSPEHPEQCWLISSGNSSQPSYYDACVQNITQYGQNKSYIEKYITCNFARVIGNAQMGGIMMGLIVIAIFLAFVMMQNTRLDGKLVVMIPVIILVSVWMGWIMWLLGLVVGAIIALALLRLFTR